MKHSPVKPISISVVSYYNTIPLVYGLEHFMPPNSIVIDKVTPTECAQKLIRKQVDISLIPVAALFNLPEYHIIGAHCIGAVSRVATVELYSCCPLHEIKSVYLDHDSRTSNMLVQVLAKKLWHISPTWLEPEFGYESKIEGTTAGVIIGNRSLNYSNKFPFCYDLAQEWQNLTKLPFVFACWASLTPIDKAFLSLFDEAQRKGIEHVKEAIDYQQTTFSFDIYSYLTKNISFGLDNQKKEAMKLFEKHCKEIGD